MVIPVAGVDDNFASHWKLGPAANDLLKSVATISGKKWNAGDLVVHLIPGGLPGHPTVERVALVGIAESGEVDQNERERRAASAGARALRDAGAKQVAVPSTVFLQGSTLGLYKTKEGKEAAPVDVVAMPELAAASGTGDWTAAVVPCNAQNWVRRLAETPANLMTPSLFAAEVLGRLVDAQHALGDALQVRVRDEHWIAEQKMGLLAGVTRGSDEPARFVEIHYTPANAVRAEPLVLVGKGVTFDSGGISIKPSAGMADMKADMTGAASVAGAIHAIAQLKIPLRVVGLMPLCENMPSGRATKPGDVHTAMNGKTVEIDNTDAEGRLILADALHYAHSFNPHTLVNVATLTGAIDIALGFPFYGTFTNSDELWAQIEQAGRTTGERAWRMPLSQVYQEQMKSSVADMKNSGGGRSGGACSAASFLSQFVTCKRWAHLDIAGVMKGDGSGYHPKGMTGIPARTLIQLAQQLSSA